MRISIKAILHRINIKQIVNGVQMQNMKDTIITWVDTFDINININNQNFLVLGNDIHAKLKEHENSLRAKQLNIEKILEMEKEHFVLKNALSTFNAEETNQRLLSLPAQFIKELFSGQPSKKKKALLKAFKENIKKEIDKIVFLETSIYNKFYKKELTSPNKSEKIYCKTLWDYFNAEHIMWFDTKQFDMTNKTNGIIHDFLSTLKNNNIDIYKILNNTRLSYEKEQKKPITSSLIKRINAEHQLVVLLEDYEKSQKNYIAEKQQELLILEKKIKELKEVKSTNSVEENIVVASLGFVVSIIADNKETIKFIEIPIAIQAKTVQTIYDYFNEEHNYLGFSSDNKKIKRNSLIDSQLKQQTSNKWKFNKQSDYHSERTLYLHLSNPTVLKNIIERLKKEIQGELLKVHAVFLDFHSSRYLCDRCQEASQFMQKSDGPFLKILSNLINNEFKVKSPSYGIKTRSTDIFPHDQLKLIIRASADIKFGNDKNPKGSINPLYVIDSEKNQTNLILLMDTNKIALENKRMPDTPSSRFKHGLHKYTFFSSSENDEPTKNLILAYNDITLKVKNEAASVIQSFWRKKSFKISGIDKQFDKITSHLSAKRTKINIEENAVVVILYIENGAWSLQEMAETINNLIPQNGGFKVKDVKNGLKFEFYKDALLKYIGKVEELILTFSPKEERRLNF